MSELTEISYEKGWQRIKASFEKLCNILEKLYKGEEIDRSQTISLKEHSEVYTMIYNMCTQREHNYSSQLYQAYEETIKEYLRSTVFPSMKNKTDIGLLRELDKRWTNHSLMRKWMEKFFAYLDRFHVKHNSLPSLSDLGLSIFSKHIFDHFKQSIFDAYLKELDQDRKHFEVNRALLKNQTKIFIELAKFDANNVYKQFETSLLAKSREFYELKHKEWSQTNSCAEYMMNVEKLLKEEEERLEGILFGSLAHETIKSIIGIFDEKLIKAYKANLVTKDTGLPYMLQNEQFEDLTRIYRLYSRLHDNFSEITSTFREFVFQKGNEVINEKKNQMVETTDKKETTSDPNFVKNLIAFYGKFQTMLDKCFTNDIYFRQAFREALEKALNQKMTVTPAEYIASFTDGLLKKAGGSEKLTETEKEFYLDRVIGLFSCVSDKDLFLDIYRHQLAKRLLQDKSESNDSEKEMISKLKLTCGAQYTSKLEGMMIDMERAQEVNKQFQDWMVGNYKGPKIIDTNVRVLCKAHWPGFRNIALTLPKSLLEAQNTFTEFYNQVTKHRSLEFVYPLCAVVVEANLEKSKCEITMTLLQFMILNFFERTQGATFKELAYELNFDEETLKKNLHSLCYMKYKFLDKQPNNKTFGPDDVFIFQADFKTPLKRIVLPMPALEETYQKSRVEEDRGMAIEAAIVRVMKSRKMDNYTNVTQEVMTILRQFKPDPKIIKKKIESLIDKEFLERDKENPTMLKYLA